MKIKLLKNEKAITLIALVVTIIVLLILAGVTIAMTVNGNSLFGRARQSTDAYDEAQHKEAETLANYSSYYESMANEYTYENNGGISGNTGIPITTNDLYAYYDSTHYTSGSSTWNNRIGNYSNMNITGNALVQSDGAINLNRKSNNTYASIDISEKSDNNLTIYLVVKAIEKNTDNARFMELPNGTSSGDTPHVYVTNSYNTVGYGVFINGRNSGVSAFNYNVIAIRLIKDENSAGGLMSSFVNNKKGEDLNYNKRGNTIYLANCQFNSRGYGNNDYKMLAIYDTAQSDDVIFNNINMLKNKYNITSQEFVSSAVFMGNASLAFDNNKTSTSPNDAITFSSNQADSYIGATYFENIIPYKYDITIMGYGEAKDYSIILQGQNNDDTWENIGDEHILTTKGNGNASYGENIDYSFDVSTTKNYKGLRIINNYSNSGHGETTWHKMSQYAMRITEIKFYYNK